MSTATADMPEKDLLDPNPFANSSIAPVGNQHAAEIYGDVGFAPSIWSNLIAGDKA
jgi:hypothetical protein